MIQSKRTMWARLVARIKEKRKAYRILVGKSIEKRPVGGRIWSGFIWLSIWISVRFL
jgi:hypothetical protein